MGRVRIGPLVRVGTTFLTLSSCRVAPLATRGGWYVSLQGERKGRVRAAEEPRQNNWQGLEGAFSMSNGPTHGETHGDPWLAPKSPKARPRIHERLRLTSSASASPSTPPASPSSSHHGFSGRRSAWTVVQRVETLRVSCRRRLFRPASPRYLEAPAGWFEAAARCEKSLGAFVREQAPVIVWPAGEDACSPLLAASLGTRLPL